MCMCVYFFVLTGLYVCPCLVIALGFVPCFACCSVCISPLSSPFSFLPSSVSVPCFLLVPFLACLLFRLLAITKTLRREYHLFSFLRVSSSISFLLPHFRPHIRSFSLPSAIFTPSRAPSPVHVYILAH